MTPVSQNAIVVASRTDPGRLRAANEDACAEFAPAEGEHLLVVADGMGGHRGGEVASRMAVEIVGRAYASAGPGTPADARLRSAIESANRAIFAESEANPTLGGMGTTLVALHLSAPRSEANATATVAHVGDSRAYRLRAGQLEPLTQDHSVVAELVREGSLSEADAALHPRRNEILRSVGIEPVVRVDVQTLEAEAGDRFLLCSDGLCGVVSDAAIQSELIETDAHAAAEALVVAANAAGGPDNVTVQVLDLPARSTPEVSPPQSEAPPTHSHARRRGPWIAGLLVVLALATTAYSIWQATRSG